MAEQMTGMLLCDYRTGAEIRPATKDEFDASVAASQADGGAGVILVEGRSCYVEGYETVLGERTDEQARDLYWGAVNNGDQGYADEVRDELRGRLIGLMYGPEFDAWINHSA